MIVLRREMVDMALQSIWLLTCQCFPLLYKKILGPLCNVLATHFSVVITNLINKNKNPELVMLLKLSRGESWNMHQHYKQSRLNVIGCKGICAITASSSCQCSCALNKDCTHYLQKSLRGLSPSLSLQLYVTNSASTSAKINYNQTTPVTFPLPE